MTEISAAGWLLAPEKPVLADGEAHVWFASLDLAGDRLDQFWQTLALDERRRAEQFYFERDRQWYIAGRGLIRAIVGSYLAVEPGKLVFAYGPQGKPRLAWPLIESLQFNLSHSHGRVLFAVTRKEQIGVDLEFIRPMPDAAQIARRFFSEQESRFLLGLPLGQQQTSFFDCWVRKEAFIKACGDGLSHPLNEFEVGLAPGEPARLLRLGLDYRADRRWSLVEIKPAPGFTGAICIAGQGVKIIRWVWPG